MSRSSLPLDESAPLMRLGGGLGMAGCCIGILILLAGCAGLEAVFALSVIPTAMGGMGFALALAGAIRRENIEDAHGLGAIFISVLSLVGGLMELAVWQQWMLFAR